MSRKKQAANPSVYADDAMICLRCRETVTIGTLAIHDCKGPLSVNYDGPPIETVYVCAYPIPCPNASWRAGGLCAGHSLEASGLIHALVTGENQKVAVASLLRNEAIQPCPSRTTDETCRPCIAQRYLEAILSTPDA